MTTAPLPRRSTTLWITLLVVALLAAAFAFAPVRAWAGQFLGLFRLQSVTVVPLDTTLLSDLAGNSSLTTQIGQLLSDSVKVSEAGEPVSAADAAEASKLAGFNVRLWPGDPAARLTVAGRSHAEIVVDLARAQSLLDELGRSDLQLPASLDGATIKIDIPASVTAAYGDCPAIGPDTTSGSTGRNYLDCILLVEVPSPTVDTPPDLNLQQLAELGLQISGMNAQEAHDFAQTVDWTSTLVIPIPRNAASYKQVQVDGVTGYLIQRPPDDAPNYGLVWVKDGIIYAITGVGSDTSKALEMANSLK